MVDNSHVISFLLGVISILLGVLVKQIGSLSNKLDGKINTVTCEEYRKSIGAITSKHLEEWSKTIDGIWGAINQHSHTGIPDNSRVIR